MKFFIRFIQDTKFVYKTKSAANNVFKWWTICQLLSTFWFLKITLCIGIFLDWQNTWGWADYECSKYRSHKTKSLEQPLPFIHITLLYFKVYSHRILWERITVEYLRIVPVKSLYLFYLSHSLCLSEKFWKSMLFCMQL